MTHPHAVARLCMLPLVISLSVSVLGADGPRITRERIEDSDYDRFTGEISVPGDMATVRKLVTDTGAYPAWLHGCLESRILAGRMETGEVFIYFVYAPPDMPWYLFMVPKQKKRDMVLRLTWQEDSVAKRLVVNLVEILPDNEPSLEGVPMPSSTELIRVKEIAASWEFSTVDSGQVAIRHKLYIDPNHKGEDLGIINKYARNLVSKSLENLAEHLPVLSN